MRCGYYLTKAQWNIERNFNSLFSCNQDHIHSTLCDVILDSYACF